MRLHSHTTQQISQFRKQVRISGIDFALLWLDRQCERGGGERTVLDEHATVSNDPIRIFQNL